MYIYEHWHALQTLSSDDIPVGEKHMRAFIAAVHSGKQPEHETMVFFASTFDEILTGEKTLKKALKLTKPAGGNREIDHINKYILAAVMVEERRPEYKSYAKTYKALERETGHKFSKLKRWHEKYKKTAQAVLKEMRNWGK